MKREEKLEIIEQLAADFDSHDYFYIADSSNLSAGDNNNLRRQFHKNGVRMQVVKNTFIAKAMEQSTKDFAELKDVLKGTSAVLFSEDIKAPAKVIKDFRKKSDRPLLKGAFIDNSVFVGDDKLDSLVSLKSKNELIGDIIGLLQSPAKNVISALQSSGGKLAGIVETLSKKEE